MPDLECPCCGSEFSLSVDKNRAGPQSLADAIEGSDVDSGKLLEELEDGRQEVGDSLRDYNSHSDPMEW